MKDQFQPEKLAKLVSARYLAMVPVFQQLEQVRKATAY